LAVEDMKLTSKKVNEKEKDKGPGKEGATAELHTPIQDPCGICLERIAIQGALPCCSHAFWYIIYYSF